MTASRRHHTLGKSAVLMGMLTFFALLTLIAVTAITGRVLDIPLREAGADWMRWAFASEPWWFALALGMMFVGVQLLTSPRLHSGGAGEQSVRNWVAGITVTTAAATGAAWLLAAGIGVGWAFTVRPLTTLPIAAVVFTGLATALVVAGGVLAGRYYLLRDPLERLTVELHDLEREVAFRAEDFTSTLRERPWAIGSVGLFVPAVAITGLAWLVDVTIPSFPGPTAALALALFVASLTMVIDVPGYAKPQQRMIAGLAWLAHTMSSLGMALLGGAALVAPFRAAPRWYADIALLALLLLVFLFSMWLGRAIQRGAERHGFQHRMLAWTFPFTMLVLSSRGAESRLTAKRRELDDAVEEDSSDTADIASIRAWLLS
ncbi:hypothetical protein L2X99_15950 [Microbacterium sp. KUDC0406]|uniref:hypothetical protein n=1 Tax=Microbacterium sp. KUDC0406 TaxID=2909588 RepID=UPI001F2DE9F4|nr:hypothetical protein [Microbacterium sp. KUDC0406]UJP09850.1 hypothetical protein L2X99_15950 [Microbacterium sp. KUDC0406]